MTTARRRRIWTQDEATITVGTANQAGQIARQIDVNILTEASLGSLAGYTVVRTHVCVLIDSSTNTGTSFIKANFGLGVFPEFMDQGDFPRLDVYNGNYYAFECFTFRMPGVASTVVLPAEAAFTRSDYRSQRKIPRTNDRLWLVWQQDTTEIVRYRSQISYLLLVP